MDGHLLTHYRLAAHRRLQKYDRAGGLHLLKRVLGRTADIRSHQHRAVRRYNDRMLSKIADSVHSLSSAPSSAQILHTSGLRHCEGDGAHRPQPVTVASPHKCEEQAGAPLHSTCVAVHQVLHVGTHLHNALSHIQTRKCHVQRPSISRRERQEGNLARTRRPVRREECGENPRSRTRSGRLHALVGWCVP